MIDLFFSKIYPHILSPPMEDKYVSPNKKLTKYRSSLPLLELNFYFLRVLNNG